MVSIIVPALNEEMRIGSTLRALQALSGEKEILVADGGSEDLTVEIATGLGVRVVPCERGRGCQIRTAALEASGTVLWFVHADTRPEMGALESICASLRGTATVGGNFSLVFEGEHYSARQMTWIYPYLRRLGLSYGDAGIFIRRSVYEAIGGCRAYSLFEDLDLIRRMKRHGKFDSSSHQDLYVGATIQRPAICKSLGTLDHAADPLLGRSFTVSPRPLVPARAIVPGQILASTLPRTSSLSGSSMPSSLRRAMVASF